MRRDVLSSSMATALRVSLTGTEGRSDEGVASHAVRIAGDRMMDGHLGWPLS